MADMLEDPDYCDSIDWSGQPGLEGVYNTVTSGNWYREVKVLSCIFVWFHLVSSVFIYIHMQEFFDAEYDEEVFICPVILASDSTHLTFSGSQKAHNVYITPAVLQVEARQKMNGNM